MHEFDQDFLWGAATSAFQIEGACATDGKGPSIWDRFCRETGKTHNGDTGDVACDHYARFREDVALMKHLGLRSYRFSISWPRVLPTGRGTVNTRGLAFYDELVDALCAARIEPVATLYHWDLPAALQDELGGWAHDDLPRLFADYAEVVFAKLGDRVRYWLTLNEPWCAVDGGYFTGLHAPGIRDRALGYRAAHNLMRGHAYAVERYHRSPHPAGAISFALNSNHFFPATEAEEDEAAAQRALENFAGWFGDPAYFGDYPAVMRERLGDLLPTFTPEDARLLRGSMDFMAVNYYTSDVVRHAAGTGPMEYTQCPQPQRPHTALDWPIVPEGLTALLLWLDARYPDLPFYITENGAALTDVADSHGVVDDGGRIRYLRDHIAAAAQARAAGVDLRGYFVWSLLDNLEWTQGYSKPFGIVRCDFATQRRTIKASGHWYTHLIRQGRLEEEAPIETGAGRL